MALDFKATVQRSYWLEGRAVLVLDHGYEGDIEQGEWVEIAQAEAGGRRGQVATVAWGSAFQATDPPLTLVVEGLDGELPEGGAAVRGAEAPA